MLVRDFYAKNKTKIKKTNKKQLAVDHEMALFYLSTLKYQFLVKINVETLDHSTGDISHVPYPPTKA